MHRRIFFFNVDIITRDIVDYFCSWSHDVGNPTTKKIELDNIDEGVS